MVDLAQLSTEDLQALKSGDLSKVSTQGLQSLRGAPAPTPPVSPQGPVAAFVDALGRAIAVPGKPEANLEALANHITSFIGGPSAQQGAAQSAATAKANPTSAMLGAGAGHLGEGALAGGVVGPLAGAGAEAALGAGRLAGAVSGATTGAVSGAASSPEAPGMGAVTGAAGGTLLGAATPTAQSATSVAGKLGFRSAEDKAGTALAGSSAGPALTEHNAQIGNAVIGNEAGLAPGTTPSYESLAAARTAPSAVYDRVATSLPTGPLDQEAQAAIKTAGAPAGGRVSAGTPQAQQQVEALRQQLLSAGPDTSGQQWVNESRALRQEGYTNIASDDVSNQQLGSSQLDMARAIEDHIGRNLPANGTVSLQDFQDARKVLAKNWTAQGVLKGDTFDLRALGRVQRADPQLLDGNMKTTADFANANNEVVGQPNPLNAPNFANDIRNVSLAEPASISQLATGMLGRRMLTGGPSVLDRTNAMFSARPPNAFPPREPVPVQGPPAPAGPPAPFTTSPGAGGPAPVAPHQGEIPLADLLSHGVEQGPSPGLSAGPMGAPPAQGVPFRVPPEHMAGDLSLAPESAPAAPSQRLGDLAAVMSQGVPEGTVARVPPPGPRMPSAGNPRFLTNNASGESAASQEAINRGTRDLALVDSDGNETPLLRDVTQADRSAPKGGLIVDRNTGEIVKRGADLNQRAAMGLRNRWASLKRLGDNFTSP